MQFSTETLKQVTQLLFSDWQQQGLGEQEMSAAEVEKQLQAGLQDVGRLVLREVWEAEDAKLHEAGVTCEHAECQGSEMKRVSRREVQVMSIWGPVRYRRGEYVCEKKHRKAALDEAQGLHPGQPTPHLEMLLGLSGAALPFEQGALWAQTWLQVEVAPNTVRRATHTLGERQKAEEERWYSESERQDHQIQHREAFPERPQRVYVSVDGGFVPMRKGQNGAEDWREAKAVVWYQEGKTYGEDQKRAEKMEIYGTLEDKEGFGKLLWSSGYHYGADLAEEVVAVADGAAWIWDLMQTYYPHAVQILDWSHAVGYLYAIHQAWEEQDAAAAEQWLTESKQWLWDGEVERVIARCRSLAETHPAVSKPAATAAGYFERHAHRMDYRRFREKGYFIGSGAIESGVKRLSAARLKIAGARWNMEGGELALKARSLFLNRSWSLLPLAV